MVPKPIRNDPRRQYELCFENGKLSAQLASLSVFSPKKFDQGWTWCDNIQMQADHMTHLNTSQYIELTCSKKSIGQFKGRERH